jgi:hypothetical protein
MKTTPNSVCTCGHVLGYHYGLDLDIDGIRRIRNVCGKCSTNDIMNWVHEFNLDNLKYLEQLSMGDYDIH